AHLGTPDPYPLADVVTDPPADLAVFLHFWQNLRVFPPSLYASSCSVDQCGRSGIFAKVPNRPAGGLDRGSQGMA
ncbi:MAG TPA: hypothetical protein VL971_07955, partial [Rhizomicrobium sp.]|nr:hypothetical protein [Rhizomicrobium sp.]